MLLRTPYNRREERESRERAAGLLRFVGLKRPDELAMNLSYGDQRRLEIARALASEPKLLLLDEPTAGMNPQESEELRQLMERLRTERGMSVLLIEHDMRVVMNVSDHITVLDHGEKIAEGSPKEVRETRGSSRRTSGARHELATAAASGVAAGAPAAPPATPLLHVDDIHTFYGSIEALKGITLEVSRGRDRHAHRLQRGRQVHDAALHLGHRAAEAWARSSSTGRRSRPSPVTRSRRSASRTRPRAGASSRA